MKYDFALDMWSIGSVIYELFTGRILFPGHSNNQVRLRTMLMCYWICNLRKAVATTR